MRHAQILETSRKEQTFAEMTREVESTYKEKLDKIKKENSEYVSSSIKRIDNILDTELVQAMKSKKKKRSWGSAAFRDGSTQKSTTTITTNDKGETVLVTEKVRMKDGEVISKETMVKPYLKPLPGGIKIPKSVPPTFSTRCASILGLDESGVLIIETVYEEYHERYEEIYAEAESIGKELYEDKKLSKIDRHNKIESNNVLLAERVAVLDEAFFSDLSAVTGLDRENKDLKMLEEYRQRQRLFAPDNPYGWRRSSNVSVDLVGLYVLSEYAQELQETLSEEAKDIIATEMQNYHGSI